MIEKERLKELIEQGATIWTINKSGNINPVKTNKTCEIQRQYLMKEGQIYSYIEQTFETKEDAEWVVEFGCIERTEKLNITDWQKFKNRDENFGFTFEDYSYKCFTDGIEIKLVEFWGQGGRSIFKAPLTKENYTLACRKCKEIFLGEKE